MGQIRTRQLDFLNQGAEQINYKVFDSDGTYQETKDENVLFSCPEHIVPLNKSLVKCYEKPLKEVEFLTDIRAFNYINQNSQFLYDSDDWTITAGSVVEANAFTVKPISGNKYYKATGNITTGTELIRGDITQNQVRQGAPIQVQLSYHFQTTASTKEYNIGLFAIIDTTGNGVPEFMFDFEENKWVTYSSNSNGIASKQYSIKNTIKNKWVGFTKSIEPFEHTTNDADVNLSIGLTSPIIAFSIGEALYIDNFVIGESVEANIQKIKNIRSRFSYPLDFTGKYVTQNIMSNELKEDEKFVGRISGSYKRPRDITGKTLEQIITQEITNDNRDYLTKYEGVFRNIDTRNLGLHNKIFIDFGIDTLQEPASCYIDAMNFDVKKAEYRVRLHTPNQDDDATSTYRSIAE